MCQQPRQQAVAVAESAHAKTMAAKRVGLICQRSEAAMETKRQRRRVAATAPSRASHLAPLAITAGEMMRAVAAAMRCREVVYGWMHRALLVAPLAAESSMEVLLTHEF